jgi:hypothetical protein
MSEAEFDRLLDAVQAAIAPAPQEDFLRYPQTSHQKQPPRAANDNKPVSGRLVRRLLNAPRLSIHGRSSQAGRSREQQSVAACNAKPRATCRIVSIDSV